MLYLLLVLAATPALSCDPTPVTELTTSFVRSSEIRVSWSPPSSTCVSGYKICLVPRVGTTECNIAQNTSITEYSVTDLQSCMEYNISVAVVGDGNTESAPVSTLATTAPNPISGFGISRRKDKYMMTVHWSYSFPTRGLCAKLFELSLCDSKEPTASCNTVQVPVTGSIYTHDLNNTIKCHTAYLNLVVVDGNQQMSDVTQFVIDPRVMSAPENLTVTSYNSTSFQVEWVTPPIQRDCEYYIYVSYVYQSGVTTYANQILYDPDVTKHTATNLTSCTAVNVTVGFGSTDNQLTTSTNVYTTPEGDKILYNATVQEETSSSIVVAWNTLLESNQCIGAYDVCVRKQGTARDMNCQNTTNDRSNHQVTGLEANSNYQVSVFALLGNGIKIDNITLDASTKSGTSGRHSSLFGISALLLCAVTLSSM